MKERKERESRKVSQSRSVRDSYTLEERETLGERRKGRIKEYPLKERENRKVRKMHPRQNWKMERLRRETDRGRRGAAAEVLDSERRRGDEEQQGSRWKVKLAQK